jgi:hypothetical protein
MLFFGCQYILILSLSSLKKSNVDGINNLIEQIVKKYNIQSKIILVSANQTIEKGILLQCQDFIIDLSLRKFNKLLNNNIKIIDTIGEL